VWCFVGIVVDVKEDEHLNHHEDQASIKQFLVSSYKNNVYPLLKQEIQQNHRELASFSSRTFRSKWSFMVILNSYYIISFTKSIEYEQYNTMTEWINNDL